jgi:hypothetical protein
MKNNKWPFCIQLVVYSLMLYVSLSASASAATFGIGSMNITGGNYVVSDSNGVLVTNPNSGSTVSPFTTFGPNTNLVGGYLGNGGGALPASTPDPASIVGGLWFGTPVNTYTAAANLGDVSSPVGSIAGGPVPSGTVDDTNNTISMNLSSLFGNWADIDFNIGTGKNDGITSPLASGTWNPVSGAYTLSWTTVVDNTVGGPCLPSHCVAQFTLVGTASPVPIPAAVWLFSSGLLGLLSIVRRRKAS